MNNEETETLTFAYDRPFHMSQRDIACFNLVDDGTLKSRADFASTLSNVNDVEISDLLEFLVMLLFSSHCSHQKIIYRKLQYYENIHGGDSFLIT